MSELADPHLVAGLPLVGSAFALARNPAQFFVACYRAYGPVFRVKIFGRVHACIAGTEAANFLATREGRDCLRSHEFWQGLVDEFGAARTISGEDGARHQALRGVMRRGYSREALAGRYDDLTAITDRAIATDWRPGTSVPVVASLQNMVVAQLGEILTGAAPLEYVDDIRTNIRTILNCLVTRQRPRFLLRGPRYRKAKVRVHELGERMIADMRARAARDDLPDNLLGDIYRAHQQTPDLIPASDLVLTLTGPYVAGLDTVANTTSACVYRVLKNPDILARVQAEANTLFAKPHLTEADLIKLPVINGCINETMRLHPIAVAQMRTATRDFIFQGVTIRAGEMLFIGTSVPHFMAEYFPNPDIFDIGRYEKPRAEHMRPGVYSPFGRGPHTCLGRSIADMLMPLTIARLFHRLDLALPSPNYMLQTRSAPTPGPSMKFRVTVTRNRR